MYLTYWTMVEKKTHRPSLSLHPSIHPPDPAQKQQKRTSQQPARQPSSPSLPRHSAAAAAAAASSSSSSSSSASPGAPAPLPARLCPPPSSPLSPSPSPSPSLSADWARAQRWWLSLAAPLIYNTRSYKYISDCGDRRRTSTASAGRDATRESGRRREEGLVGVAASPSSSRAENGA